ncbi:MAG: hypothetical protein AB7O38_21500, partial [Pirellulaceae bacterium]
NAEGADRSRAEGAETRRSQYFSATFCEFCVSMPSIGELGNAEGTEKDSSKGRARREEISGRLVWHMHEVGTACGN